jgi:ribonucleotide reductase alpha subunit
LCTEIVEYTSPDETAVCNLASISLSKLVTPRRDYESQGMFEFDKLFEVSKVITRNLNRIIDRNFYPIESARR